ncbi:MAG TPA: HAD-IIIC family phosphatase [Chloroflexota bacterium]|nr:HAD-IIIC family phosphatase [Chloroflexota bacterium]
MSVASPEVAPRPADTVERLLAWVRAKPTLARYGTAAQRLAALPREMTSGLSETRFALLRNFTLEPLLPVLEVGAWQAGWRPATFMSGYDDAHAQALTAGSPLYAFGPDAVIVAFRLDLLAPKLLHDFLSFDAAQLEREAAGIGDRIEALVAALRRQVRSLILVNGFELPCSPALGFADGHLPAGQLTWVRRLNLQLAERLQQYPDAYLLDLDHLFARVGYDECLDPRGWQMSQAPYTKTALVELAQTYVEYLRAFRGPIKKCLVLDCDNTLWGGVLGEEGPAGIQLGRDYPGSCYTALQEAVVNLSRRGVIVALCSKNDEVDVLDVIRTHPHMVLREEHLAGFRVNWNDKAANLRELASELNIGLDSMVFVDDSPFEAALVRSQLPEVTVWELPPNPSEYAAFLQRQTAFDSLDLSDEDRQRTRMYRAEAARRTELASSVSLEDFYRSLQMEVCVERVADFDVPRVAQLTQRTNQFNLTTRRRTETEIAELARDDRVGVFTAKLSDKYGDSGLVAVAIVRLHEGEAELDTFLMSCRVFGRSLESLFLHHIIGWCAARGAAALGGSYVPTGKNGLVKDFLADHGFALIDAGEQGATRWRLTLPALPFSPPAWFERQDIRLDD